MAPALIAIVSDVHGNRHALEAVLRDSEAQGADELWCLGDIVGYGPEPIECLSILRERAHAIIRGNHEQAVLEGPTGFNPMAAAAIRWTRIRLDAAVAGAQRAASGADGASAVGTAVAGAASADTSSSDLLRFIASLPERSDQHSAVLVHGSPGQPLDEYLFKEDALDQMPRNRDYSPKLARCFRLIDRPCFIGHTHVPGIIGEDLAWTSPEDCGGSFDTHGERCLVNVGSTGQPRDGDVRASYALFDGRHVMFRRVAYDLEATARAIRATPGLPDALALRLEEGW